ncbi:MAG: ABC transporter ATP-binding protein [Myxococcaceae bacterium]|nr:ABC transporter ATP-binding protein [Myxococcaceae bacterium]MCI0673427.1 ABC transporter ATP-binding protein [Myxococcaceae bacterium]
MSTPAIALAGVTKRFGATEAVSRLSLTVEEGQCFGLIGPNGAGKTTTFSLLCGFLHPTAGEVRVLGLTPSAPAALKRKVGVLPQDALLPPGWRVGPLLTYWARLSGLGEPEREAREALARVELPQAWDVETGALSHGMAKRVSLAQALMGEPPVVLLDEPTAGLDPKSAAHVRQLVRDMRGRQTVVVSSHNLGELEDLCDAAAILDRGRLAQAGTMGELTGQAVEFRVELARGEVPFAELAALPGVREAFVVPPGVLVVRHAPQAPPAEDVISDVVALLLQRGVRILSVTRGQRLEARVLQLL